MHWRSVGLWSVTLAALFFAGALVVRLAMENRALKERQAEVVERATTAHPGLVVPELRAATLAGDSVTVAAAGTRQVLFFFTTTCPHCRASVPAWKRLAAEAQVVGVAVVGVQLDSALLGPPYVREHALPYPVVVFAEEAEARRVVALYRARRVPLTLVVDRDGQVVFARAGAITTDAGVDSVLAAVGAGGNGDSAASVVRP